MTHLNRLFGLTLALGLFTSPALAQTGPDPVPHDVLKDMLDNQQVDPDTQKQLQIASLAMSMGQFNVATLAYDEALKVLTNQAESPARDRRISQVHKDRAIARYFADDTDGAISDIDLAIDFEKRTHSKAPDFTDLQRLSDLRLLKIEALSTLERYDDAVQEIQRGAFELIDFQDANPGLAEAMSARLDYQIAGFAASLFWMGQEP